MSLKSNPLRNKPGCYEILNTVNGKCYIGQAQNLRKRWNQHRWHLKRGLHHSQILQRAWDKHGEDMFKFRPLLICSIGMLDFYEQRCMDVYKPEYNVSPFAGTCRGYKYTPKQRERLLGNTYCLGFKHPPEFGDAISARIKGIKQRPESVQKSALSRTGAKRSPESCERMSRSHIGKKRSPESNKKQSDTMRGRKKDDGFGRKVSLAKRAVNDLKRPPSKRTIQQRLDSDRKFEKREQDLGV